MTLCDNLVLALNTSLECVHFWRQVSSGVFTVSLCHKVLQNEDSFCRDELNLPLNLVLYLLCNMTAHFKSFQLVVEMYNLKQDSCWAQHIVLQHQQVLWSSGVAGECAVSWEVLMPQCTLFDVCLTSINHMPECPLFILCIANSSTVPLCTTPHTSAKNCFCARSLNLAVDTWT